MVASPKKTASPTRIPRSRTKKGEDVQSSLKPEQTASEPKKRRSRKAAPVSPEDDSVPSWKVGDRVYVKTIPQVAWKILKIDGPIARLQTLFNKSENTWELTELSSWDFKYYPKQWVKVKGSAYPLYIGEVDWFRTEPDDGVRYYKVLAASWLGGEDARTVAQGDIEYEVLEPEWVNLDNGNRVIAKFEQGWISGEITDGYSYVDTVEAEVKWDSGEVSKIQLQELAPFDLPWKIGDRVTEDINTENAYKGGWANEHNRTHGTIVSFVKNCGRFYPQLRKADGSLCIVHSQYLQPYAGGEALPEPEATELPMPAEQVVEEMERAMQGDESKSPNADCFQEIDEERQAALDGTSEEWTVVPGVAVNDHNWKPLLNSESNLPFKTGDRLQNKQGEIFEIVKAGSSSATLNREADGKVTSMNLSWQEVSEKFVAVEQVTLTTPPPAVADVVPGDSIMTSSGTATVTQVEQVGIAQIIHANYGGNGVDQPHRPESLLTEPASTLPAMSLADLASAFNALEEDAVEAHKTQLQAGRAHWEARRTQGEILLQAKAQVKHGEWESWIEQNCRTVNGALSVRTAQNLMLLAKFWEEFAKNESHFVFNWTQGLTQLSKIRKALKPTQSQLSLDVEVQEFAAEPMPSLEQLKALYAQIGSVIDWEHGFRVERPDLGNPFPLAFKTPVLAWSYWQERGEKLLALAERKPIPTTFESAYNAEAARVTTLEPLPQPQGKAEPVNDKKSNSLEHLEVKEPEATHKNSYSNAVQAELEIVAEYLGDDFGVIKKQAQQVIYKLGATAVAMMAVEESDLDGLLQLQEFLEQQIELAKEGCN